MTGIQELGLKLSAYLVLFDTTQSRFSLGIFTNVTTIFATFPKIGLSLIYTMTIQ